MLKETELAIQRLADRYAPEWIEVANRKPGVQRRVLLRCPQMNELIVGFRAGEDYFAAWFNPQLLEKPTHWLPLPTWPSG